MDSLTLKNALIDCLTEAKADAITVLDVRKHTSLMDYMIVCTGRSSRHVKSVAEKVMESAKTLGASILGHEGEQAGEWVLVDLNDIVVHIMQAHLRDFYQIEKLWDISEHSKSR